MGGRVTLAGSPSAIARGIIDLVDGTIGTLTLADANPGDTVLTFGGNSAGRDAT